MKIAEEHILPHIVQLAKKFISVPSTADNPEKLKEVLNIAKKELQGYFPIEEFESNGIPSLLVHNTHERTKHFKIILNAHVDVVPGKEEQYYPVEKDGKLYGRGTYDMKSATAVMILLFKNLAKEIAYPLALQIVTDEETGSANSTQYQIAKGIRGEFIIIGEGGSNLNIKNKSKGMLHLELKTSGITAHGAYPWLGENAILKMQKVIDTVRRMYLIPKKSVWKTTASLARIETTNYAFNKVPDNCTAYLDIRYIYEDQDTVVKNIQNNIPEWVRIKVLTNDPATYIRSTNPYIQSLKRATKNVIRKNAAILGAHGASDIRFYRPVHCDGVEFGPIGHGHHSDNEYVDIKSLEDYYHILKNFLLSVKP